jgi:transposase
MFGVSRNTITAWLKKSPEDAAIGDDLARCSTG